MIKFLRSLFSDLARFGERQEMISSRRAAIKYRRFVCECGADWMTTIPDVTTCQVCYHRSQPDIVNWIKEVR